MSKPLSEYTAAELRDWRDAQTWDDANPGDLDKLNAIIMQTEIKEQVGAAVKDIEVKDAGRKLDEKALKDWPELQDKESPMYKKVEDELAKDPHAMEKPSAFADAANRVGLEMGLTPAGFTPARGKDEPMEGIGGGEGRGEKGEGSEPGKEFLERTGKIAGAYSKLLDMSDEKTRAAVVANVEGEDK